MIAYLILASPVAYCVVGWYLARQELPRAWELAWLEHEGSKHYWEKWRLDFVKGRLAVTFLFWPVVTPGRILSRRINDSLKESDPAEIKKKMVEQQRYIERLERELGMGDK